jgi:hypothetical protein
VIHLIAVLADVGVEPTRDKLADSMIPLGSRLRFHTLLECPPLEFVVAVCMNMDWRTIRARSPMKIESLGCARGPDPRTTYFSK